VTPPPSPPGALDRALARERIQSARRINLLRFWGVSAFFALFLLLGGLLDLPAWQGNIGLFTAYWAVAAAVLWAGRRSARVASLSILAIALFDMPIVFLLQWATFPTSPSASGVAGFTVGVYVLLVILAALSLEHWFILFTAAVGAGLEVVLQYLAAVSTGAMVSTVLLLGLTAAACSYARNRLVELVVRVDRENAEQRRAESALQQAERMGRLAGLGHDLSGTLDPEDVARRAADGIAHLLQARTGVLFRAVGSAGALVVVATSGGLSRDFPRGRLVPPGAGAAGRAVAARRAVTTPDVLADDSLEPDLRERVATADHRAVCAVPLLVRETVIGALEVGDVAGRVFTADEVHLAQAFADHASLSLENARLYAERAGQVRQLEAAQQQLLQAGKLAAVGQLVSGVAHELNNPLAVMVGQCQILRARLRAPDHVRRVDRIHESALRAAKIVGELQTFVRPRPREVAPVDLRDVLARVVDLRGNALRLNGVALACEFPPPPPVVLGDAAQLEQVFFNLVLNAEHALQGRADPRLELRIEAGGDQVRATVADNGRGIGPEVLPRIFEPFFSTKPVGEGTGLGLAICYSIVHGHRGRLAVDSRPDEGARFVVELPAHHGEPVAVPPGEGAVPALRPGHVLVVDDEDAVAAALCDVLEELGLRASVLHEGEAAWRALVECSDTFDVVTLDLRMPGLSGRGLYERLATLMPAVAARVVFVTGDTADPETLKFFERVRCPVITKPFSAHSLATALAPLLPG
jgi:signal transduction histidine kinase